MFISRTIVDTDGTRWLVHEVAHVAATPALEALRQKFERRRPWLAFESEAGAVRALVPVPTTWPRCSDVTLVTWLARADPITPAVARRAADPSVGPTAQDEPLGEATPGTSTPPESSPPPELG